MGDQDLRKGLRRRAGVEVGGSLDELGLALVRLQGPRASVPELVDELHEGRDPAALWAGPNYVLGPCTHLHISGSIPQPTSEHRPPPPAVGSRPGQGCGDLAARLGCRPGPSLVRRPG
jgi:hypothetical protein